MGKQETREKENLKRKGFSGRKGQPDDPYPCDDDVRIPKSAVPYAASSIRKNVQFSTNRPWRTGDKGSRDGVVLLHSKSAAVGHVIP